MPLATRDPIAIATTFEEMVEKINLLLGNLDYNIEDIVGAMVASGSVQDGISVTYDSLNKKLDFEVTGGGGGGDTEFIQDTVGPMFAHGGHTGITATYNDVTGLVTLSVIDSYVNVAGDTMTGDLNLNSAARLIKNQVSVFGASVSFADAGLVVGPNATTGLAIGRDAIKTNGGTLTLGSISNHDVLFYRQNAEYARLITAGVKIVKDVFVDSSTIAVQSAGVTTGLFFADSAAAYLRPAIPSRELRILGGAGGYAMVVSTIGGFDTVDLYHGGDSKLRTTANGVSAQGYRILNVATPVAGTDAVNKTYADARSAGPTYINPFIFYTKAATGAGTQSGSFSTPGVFPAGSRYALVRAFVPINTGQTITQVRPDGSAPWITVTGTVGSGGDETNHGTFVTLQIPLRSDGVFFWQIVSTGGFNSAELAIVGYVV